MNFRSVTAGGSHRDDQLTEEWLPRLMDGLPVKFWWFLSKGYQPHIWQSLFHAARSDNGNLARFRHLVAGRRGGKTLSAAWEVLFYALHPSEFHRDAHGKESNRPLWIWALAKNNKVGRPSLITFLDVLNQAGLIKDKDYRFNRQERIFEFIESNTVVEFKSADDPQSLRGAGLDILWMDEAAFVPNDEAWHVVRPALSDKLGLLITTTTPMGKNWFYEEFWSDLAQADQNHFRVEYTSIDNPHFPHHEWAYAKTHMHPVVFAQEYLAAFDAMQGVALQGDWLHYYTVGDPGPRTDAIRVPVNAEGKLELDTYIGIDPAISLADTADDFAMSLIGVTKDRSQVFLLDYFLGHISFPDQLDKIHEWHLKYRPMYIGIESNAAQGWLAQQAQRLEGMPGIVPVFAKGKKHERILAMAPLFKIGKIRIHPKHIDFIDQWVSFDPAMKNQRDDLLDSVEIALGMAGVLLPMMPSALHFDDGRYDASDVDAEAREQVKSLADRNRRYDPELGIEA